MKLIFKLFGIISFWVIPTISESKSPYNRLYVSIGSGLQQEKENSNASTTASQISIPSSPVFGKQKSLTTNTLNALNDSKNTSSGIFNLGYSSHLLTNTPKDLALEGFANVTPKNHTRITTSKTTTTSPIATVSSAPFGKAILSSQTIATFNHFEYGVDLRRGVARWFDSLIYGRVGVGFNKASLTINNQLAINHSTFGLNLPINTTLNPSTDKNIAGLRLGIGLEKQMGNHVAFFVDYIHTNYGRLNTQKTGDGFSNQSIPGFASILPATVKSAFSTQAEASFSINQVFLGLRYYFA